MVSAILVEIVPVNDHRVDMPGLSPVRSGDAGVSCAMRRNGILEIRIRVAQRDGHVIPRVVAQRAAGAFVTFVAGIYVCGRDSFVYLVSKRRGPG